MIFLRPILQVSLERLSKVFIPPEMHVLFPDARVVLMDDPARRPPDRVSARFLHEHIANEMCRAR
jgi:hypothetical protein